ncbi:MAG: dTDP-4-dehydrorhamnose 3,5-epimerase [Microscillaceae bacterium]|nr:dTDP-4-dehydrorhamnose 3,5-epimerase [Microscillaceae bacterium]MDW8461176.1 dTDP-4-dehydrorhamnose 3,5-epimerase [Cytophagales bacterium]
MPFVPTPLEGVFVFEPHVFEDERGYFYESFNQKVFEEATGITRPFVQDNHSFSYYGVMRGLHCQKPPFEQAKLVRVLSGEVLDVIVDLRPNSPTFAQTYSIVLSAQNRKQLYIPRGFAHGFVVLSREGAEFAYKCDNFYAPKHESGIIYNDTKLNIDWQVPSHLIKVSSKDLQLKTFEEMIADYQAAY